MDSTVRKNTTITIFLGQTITLEFYLYHNRLHKSEKEQETDQQIYASLFSKLSDKLIIGKLQLVQIFQILTRKTFLNKKNWNFLTKMSNNCTIF